MALVLAAALVVAGVLMLRYLGSGKPRTPAPAAPEPALTAAAEAPPSAPTSAPVLSEATLRVLHQLKAPVEIRFYALLEDAPATTGTRSFAERVSRLLGEFEKAGRGLLQVNRLVARTSGTEMAARADGMEALRVSGSLTNFLGLTLSSGGQRAVLASLASEWEEALEFDISRALARITSGVPTGEMVLNPTQESMAAREEVRQALPGLDAMTFDEARKQLLNAGLEEYKVVVTEFQRQLQQAQQRLAAAQGEGGAAVEEARRELQELQARQGQQLSELSQRLQARLAALEQIKGGQ